MTAVVLLVVYLTVGAAMWLAFCRNGPCPVCSFVMLTLGWPIFMIAAVLYPGDDPWRRP